MLAFALLPGLAQAEECSGGAGCINYNTGGDVPHLEGTVKQAHPKPHKEKTNPKAESSEVSPGDGETGETGEESEQAGATGGTGGDHGGTGNGQQGHKQGAGNKGSKPDSNGKQAIANASGGPQASPLESNSSEDSGGGSSSLVWIIIAIVVLAAISIGAFVIRQRRQDGEGGSSVSPKAS